MDWTVDETARMGDHRWWISDLAAFRADHPGWSLTYDVEGILREIYEHNAARWMAPTG
jgi:CDP-paratose 2-epimerase